MRICVVALPRSGSSTLCKHLSELHSLRNIGEVVRNSKWSKYNQISSLKQDNIVYKLVPQNVAGFIIDEFVEQTYTTKYGQKIQMLKLQDNSYKAAFYARHKETLHHRINSMCAEIASYADTHFFIERRDLKKQILSFAALLQTSHGGKNRLDEVYIQDKNIITAKEFAFGMIGIPFYKNLKNQISGEIVFTEDLKFITNFTSYPEQRLFYNTELLGDINDVL